MRAGETTSASHPATGTSGLSKSVEGMTATRSEPSLGVVIPAYNEEAGIERTVAAVCEVLRQLPCPARLLVVEDGSQDRTLAILQRLAAQQPLLTVVPH